MMSTLVIPPGHSHSVQMGGLGVVFKLSGSDTGGAFSIVEHPMAPGTLGAPLHTNEDELSYVLKGEITVLLGDELIHASAGRYVFKPRGIPHAFWNASDGPLHPGVHRTRRIRAVLWGNRPNFWSRPPKCFDLVVVP